MEDITKRIDEIEARAKQYEEYLDYFRLEPGDRAVFIARALEDIPWLVERLREAPADECYRVLKKVIRYMYDSHQQSHPNNRPWSNYAESVMQDVEALFKKIESGIDALAAGEHR